MAHKLLMLLMILVVAGVASVLAERDTVNETEELSAALQQARKLLKLGGPVRKQLAFDSGSTFGAPAPKGGYGDEGLDTSPPESVSAWTSPPVDRGGASLSGGSSASGAQSAAVSAKPGGNGSKTSGSTAAAVVGTLIGLVVVGVLTLFAWKQYNRSRSNNQRYSSYSTFDNEMAHVRY